MDRGKDDAMDMGKNHKRNILNVQHLTLFQCAETVDSSGWLRLRSTITTFCHFYLWLMTAIFDLTLSPISGSVHNSLAELVGVAFGIPWLSSIEAEILR